MNNIKKEIHDTISSILNENLIYKFDFSIINIIFFLDNTNLYEINLKKSKLSFRLVDNTLDKKKCDLLLVLIESNKINNLIFDIIENKVNDLVFFIDYNENLSRIFNEILLYNFVEIKDYNKSIVNNYPKFKNSKLIKKVDNPNLDSSLLIQSICNDNGDKYIMMGYDDCSLQFHFKQILIQIQNSFKNKEHLSYLRFGDGDFYFLRNFNHGSAKLGTRSVLKKINIQDLKSIRASFWKTKNICMERTYDSYNRIFLEVLFSYFDNSKILRFILAFIKKIKIENYLQYCVLLILTSNKFKFLGKKKFFYKTLNILIQNKIKKLKREDLIDNFKYCNFLPVEGIYALVSSRWIFKNYPKNIAVVGNVEKIHLIKKLSKNQDYLDYLGIEKFVDFIEVPQKGAASDLNLSHKLKKRIAESNADIFLLGIGSMKIYLLPLLQDINKVFIDVGCGIDALAGVVSQDRPYFSRWINYQFENKSFDNIDLMDQNNPMRFAKKYSTVYIKEAN